MDNVQLNGSGTHTLAMNMVQPSPDASSEIVQNEDEISIKNLLEILWRRLWVIVLVPVLLTTVVIGVDLLRTPTYEATIKILIGQEEGEAPPDLGSEVPGLQELSATMTEVIATRPVAEAVIDRLDLGVTPGEFLDNLSVAQVGATQIIEVSYNDENPERAAQIVNSVGDVFSVQVSSVNPSANAIIWERAAVPDSPTSPNPLRDGMSALVLGSMLGVGLAFLLEQLDDRWRSPDEVEQVSGVPTFGVIPSSRFQGAKMGRVEMIRSLHSRQGQDEETNGHLSESLLTLSAPASVASEAYRTLRTSLLYSLVDKPPKIITVTSAGIQEDKSMICANLAVVLAQASKKTLVMDCDLRNPMLHKIFGVRNSYGVVNALVGEENRPETWWQEPRESVPGLKVATAGPVPPNPVELLGSRRFAHVLRDAREKFDYVLIATPPVGPVSDPSILATLADGVLLVIDSQNTRKRCLRQAVRNLQTVGSNIIGTVVSNAKVQKGNYYGYGYDYKN